MPGLGRKVFAPGEVLTATNVQNYLMDQAVQVYADSASRGSAIGSATTDGMVTWLQDTDQLQVATGTATWQDVSLVQSPNAIINGGFDIWQRGTSVTAATNGVAAADRWYMNISGSFTASQQTTGVPPGSRYCLRVLANGAQTARSIQFLETNESLKLAGKTVTAQIKIRRNASLTQDIVLAIQKSATVDAGIGATWATISSVTIANSQMPTGTTSANWYTAIVTASIPSDGTANSLRFFLDSGTIPNGGYYEIAEAQLEVGSVATPFRRNAPSIQAELAACQRYYYRSTGPQVFSIVATGLASSTTSATMLFNLPVTMRTAPSAVEWATIQISDIASAATPSSIVLSSTSSSTNIATLTVTTTGLTAFRPYVLSNASNVAGYIGVTAEL
jgi:hypothetical protein